MIDANHLDVTSNSSHAPEVLRLLGHDLRWQILVALGQGDLRVSELVALTSRPQNLVSYHLRQLRQAGLVRERRSSADSRDIYYRLDLGQVADGLRAGALGLHPALWTRPGGDTGSPPDRPWRVLFLCTHNSARSQMAEGLLRAAAGPTAEVASAGNEPSTVHPLAVRVMAERGIDISGQASTHLDVYRDGRFDYVITVCDRVREVCPAYGRPTRLSHWSIADPAEASGNDEERLAVFRRTAEEIAGRVADLLVSLSVSNRTTGMG